MHIHISHILPKKATKMKLREVKQNYMYCTKQSGLVCMFMFMSLYKVDNYI